MYYHFQSINHNLISIPWVVYTKWIPHLLQHNLPEEKQIKVRSWQQILKYNQACKKYLNKYFKKNHSYKDKMESNLGSVPKCQPLEKWCREIKIKTAEESFFFFFGWVEESFWRLELPKENECLEKFLFVCLA